MTFGVNMYKRLASLNLNGTYQGGSLGHKKLVNVLIARQSFFQLTCKLCGNRMILLVPFM